MRALRRTLLAAVGCVALVLAFAASGAAKAPAALATTSYDWAQPWSLGPAVASTQPVVGWTVTPFRPSSAYVWVQPWSRPRVVAHTQPPAWVTLR